MQIDFSIGPERATFERSWVTGKSTISAGEKVVTVASPGSLGTHFHFGRTRTSEVSVGGHDVMVEATGPPAFRALFPLNYRILVDGAEVASRRGF